MCVFKLADRQLHMVDKHNTLDGHVCDILTFHRALSWYACVWWYFECVWVCMGESKRTCVNLPTPYTQYMYEISQMWLFHCKNWFEYFLKNIGERNSFLLIIFFSAHSWYLSTEANCNKKQCSNFEWCKFFSSTKKRVGRIVFSSRNILQI